MWFALLLLLACVSSAMPQAADPADIEVVHIVSMCHLDGGYAQRAVPLQSHD